MKKKRKSSRSGASVWWAPRGAPEHRSHWRVGRELCARVALLAVLLASHWQPCKSQNETNTTTTTTAAAGRRLVESSELSFDFLDLRSLPATRELCTIEAQNLNSVSFANNRIELIDAEAFACIGARLRILDLSNNRISLISPDAFAKLRQLEVLLLDGNRIATFPSMALQALGTLRHLSLAKNQIESIGWPSGASLAHGEQQRPILVNEAEHQIRAALPNLISLNLRANPARAIAPRAFELLPKLKTLTLSQINLASWSAAWPLLGLDELRFLQLDRALAANASEPLEFGCAHARKLATLSLRANRLNRVPKFEPNCQAMQSLDLAYNHIQGRLDGGQFAHLSSLLDLYLGHNAIESLGAGAFDGLERLQKLELQANRLVQVHARALAALGRSLVELNVAQNALLAELPLPDDSRVQVLWAHANPALRRLPKLRHAERLSLTYAYHCCDYPASSSEQQRRQHYLVEAAAHAHDEDDEPGDEQGAQQSPSLLAHLAGTIFARFAQPGAGSGANASDADQHAGWTEPAGASNLGELVVWQTSGAAAAAHYGEQRENYYHSKARVIDGAAGQALAHKSSGEQNYIVQRHHHGHHRGEHRRLQQQQQQQHLRPKTAPAVECAPRPNAFMPCQDLFDSWWLRLGVWLVFASSLGGNLLVIIVLGSARPSSSSSALANLMWLAGHSKRHIDVPRFLVLNLAFADLLMALYLGLLATLDLRTLGEFRLHAIKWQYSAGCRLAAFLAVLSSELSVFILAIITLERNYAITNAVHLNRRLSLQKAMVIMMLGYTFALIMALGPVQGLSDYRKFSVCLPLDFETNAWSRAYVVTLISINALSFLLLLSCYLRMYCAIRGSQAWNANDLKIAKRMSVLIFTDFLCWMPIILVACFALAGQYLVGPRGLKVLTIFVLPLNSVANPFLYAITTKKFKRDLITLKRRVARLVGATAAAQDQEQQQLQQQKQQPAKYHQSSHRCEHMLRATQQGPAQWQELAGQRSLRCHRGGREQCTLVVSSGAVNKRQQAGRNLRTQQQPPTGAGRQQKLASNKRSAWCSCGRTAPSTSARQPTPVSKHQVAVQVRLSSASSMAECNGPRIVLDSFCEPALDIALTPLALVGTEREQCASSAAAASTSGAGTVADRATQSAEHAPESGSRLRCANGQQSCGLDSAKQRPAGSVGVLVEARQQSGHRTPVAQHLASCQQIAWSPIESKARLLDDERCASALAYRPPAGDIASACTHKSHSPAQFGRHSPEQARAPNKLTRSISRLLLGPLARAWSSIQSISLQSVNAQAAATATTATDQSGSISSASMQAKCQCAFCQVGDQRRVLANQQRRMSRSCDQLTTYTHMTLLGAAELSSADSQPMGVTSSTSQSAAGDDDRRVLLATINRLAADGNGKRAGQVISKLAYGRAETRLRCTARCRSWSPALLGKLDDCIHHIKEKFRTEAPD